MGRRSIAGGVTPKGSNLIQFDFEFDDVRYRPTLERAPTEANLRRARKQIDDIRARIANETFSFAEEFPDSRNVDQIEGAVGKRTCNQVFDEFMATRSRAWRNTTSPLRPSTATGKSSTRCGGRNSALKSSSA
jgi:hypothetical protein